MGAVDGARGDDGIGCAATLSAGVVSLALAALASGGALHACAHISGHAMPVQAL
ncbi:conserved hypothetical protein [Paraburkholderia caribensis]|uniref:Uncharacterized protein n=1 Tax=Paraburkholderia largidicola TaxID=3014751 RepID=A0A7I8BEU4_9BURK|nr:hypothetical protein PPGU16_01830 [Paraburkholderia sp. PGU16]CAG9262040.1 conserved hypothetical protein [Paraburkholderia caribensis]